MTYSSKERIWISHREDVTITKEGPCNVFFLLDATTVNCLSFLTSKDLPGDFELANMLNEAKRQTGTWPDAILISQSSPLADGLQKVCSRLKVPLKKVPSSSLAPMVMPFKTAFQSFKARDDEYRPPTDVEKKEMEAFIPDAYAPCTCGSGKKYRFCCQKAHRPIVMAMCEAQDGRKESALRYMKEAELAIGRTAEVVTRYAVCWSFFDMEKYYEYREEALAINPNHPRLNFLLGKEEVGKKNYSAAISFYQKAIVNYPPESRWHLNEVHNNLGTAYYESGDFRSAKHAWEKGLTYLPSDEMVKNNLFNCIYDNPDLPEDIREISPFILKILR